jgi:hypothetical protein
MGYHYAANGAGGNKNGSRPGEEEGVKFIIDKIDNATREETSGTFVTFNGEPLGW